MKWFKHISDSLDDPFIFDLMRRFDALGYLVFFGILEIYSREFKPEPNWNLTITHAYLRQKLRQTKVKRIINVLKMISEADKWKIDFFDDYVVIFIPKFTQLIDEWTQRKIGSKSGVTPEIPELNKNKEAEEEVDKEEEKEKLKEKEKPPFLGQYKKLLQQIQESRNEPAFLRQITLFVESNMKTKNQDAILHCLDSLVKALKNGTMIINARAYLEKALGSENGNYNEQEHIAKAEEFKGPSMTSLKDIFSQMGGKNG